MQNLLCIERYKFLEAQYEEIRAVALYVRMRSFKIDVRTLENLKGAVLNDFFGKAAGVHSPGRGKSHGSNDSDGGWVGLVSARISTNGYMRTLPFKFQVPQKMVMLVVVEYSCNLNRS